jgi:hypothetical protein
MGFPLTLDEYLTAIARETARMSWPGRMASVLREGAKRDTEAYFTSNSFLAELTKIWKQEIHDYDSWHTQRLTELGPRIASKVRQYPDHGHQAHYRPEAVAAKLLNTFMHQLMKYQEPRYLWEDLHLVLDQRVFTALRKLVPRSITLQKVDNVLTLNPYTISTDQYKSVQRQLREFISELGRRPGRGFDLNSRIQLNLLWVDGR